jgi:hypothetical protein
MRRAVPSLLLLMAMSLAPSAHAASNLIDGVGLIDFMRRPDLTVGSWVKYHVSAKSLQGRTDDYYVTILVAGEENFWGDPAFWIETQTQGPAGEITATTASLVSYAAFSDSLPWWNFTRYIRKMINEFDRNGRPIQQLYQRAPAELIKRDAIVPAPHIVRDTLGIDTVSVPVGTFRAQRIKSLYREIVNTTEGDSTIHFELRESRTQYYVDEVPITRLVRRDFEDSQLRRAWLIGKSGDTPMVIPEQVLGSCTLIEMGRGRKSKLIPEAFQRPLSEQKAPVVTPAKRVARTGG